MSEKPMEVEQASGKQRAADDPNNNPTAGGGKQSSQELKRKHEPTPESKPASTDPSKTSITSANAATESKSNVSAGVDTLLAANTCSSFTLPSQADASASATSNGTTGASAPSIVSALSASKPADAVGVAVLSDQQDADEDTSSRPGLQMGTHPMLSPIEVDTPTIERARHGVKGDVEDNECFDPIFYTNLVAMRQHDQAQRPQTATQAEEMFEQAEVEVNVVARMVSKRDVRARITVHQTTYLGSGAFSDVYRGTALLKTKKGDQKFDVAIKKIWPDASREDRQIAVHRRFDHPNLVKLLFYYVCVHPQSKETMWSLLMEVVPSTVAQEQGKFIERNRIMPQVYIKLFIYQTLCGLHYLECTRYLHRDVKPENLLVNMDTGMLKIGDFGSAKRYRPGEANSAYQVTRYYRAPELCMKFTRYDSTVDIWAVGCILTELLTNRIMFYGSDNADQLKKILRICGTPDKEQLRACVGDHQVDPKMLETVYPAADWYRVLRHYNRSVNKTCANFVSRVLRYERAERLRGPAALQHAFFNSLRRPNAKLPNGAPFPQLEHLRMPSV